MKTREWRDRMWISRVENIIRRSLRSEKERLVWGPLRRACPCVVQRQRLKRLSDFRENLFGISLEKFID